MWITFNRLRICERLKLTVLASGQFIFLRASAAPRPSASSFIAAISRRIGAIPQFVQAMIFCAGTYCAALAITAAISSGVSMVSVATSMTPISTSLPSSSLSTLIGTCELMHSSDT